MLNTKFITLMYHKRLALKYCNGPIYIRHHLACIQAHHSTLSHILYKSWSLKISNCKREEVLRQNNVRYTKKDKKIQHRRKKVHTEQNKPNIKPGAKYLHMSHDEWLSFLSYFSLWRDFQSFAPLVAILFQVLKPLIANLNQCF